MSLPSVFSLTSNYALQINATRQAPVTFKNKAGGTVYYNTERVVSSASKEGELATGKSVIFNKPHWVIASASTQVETSEFTTSIEEAATNPPGFVTYQATALSAGGTDLANAEKKLWVASVFVPVDKTCTGVNYLLGAGGGTTRVIAGLWNASGELLANSTTTSEGTVAGTEKTIQALAFTAPITITGPALYYIGITGNGTTSHIYAIPVGLGNVWAGEVELETKNTLENITPPTTFTAGKGPIAGLY